MLSEKQRKEIREEIVYILSTIDQEKQKTTQSGHLCRLRYGSVQQRSASRDNRPARDCGG